MHLPHYKLYIQFVTQYSDVMIIAIFLYYEYE